MCQVCTIYYVFYYILIIACHALPTHALYTMYFTTYYVFYYILCILLHTYYSLSRTPDTCIIAQGLKFSLFHFTTCLLLLLLRQQPFIFQFTTGLLLLLASSSIFHFTTCLLLLLFHQQPFIFFTFFFFFFFFILLLASSSSFSASNRSFSSCHAFWKVSAWVHFIYQGTIRRRFQNVCSTFWKCALRMTSHQCLSAFHISISHINFTYQGTISTFHILRNHKMGFQNVCSTFCQNVRVAFWKSQCLSAFHISRHHKKGVSECVLHILKMCAPHSEKSVP